MNVEESILIVDDEAPVRTLIKNVLAEEGYQVEAVGEGRQALDMLAHYSFALIITDLMMPEVSGLDIIAEAKARLPLVEVILMTAHGSFQSAVEALRLGAHDYLNKPFTPSELLHSVQQTLDYRRLKLENARLYAEARRVNELEALYQAGQTLNRTLNLRQTLTTTLAIARNLTRAPMGNVYLYTSEPQRIDSVITLSEEFSLSDVDRRQAAEIAGQILEDFRRHRHLEQKAIIVSSPLTASPESNGLLPRVQTWLAVPLIPAGDALVGILELGSDRIDAFTADDARLVQVVAGQAAVAIENARLYEELSSAYQNLARHQEEILRSHKTLQALFDGITDGLYIVDQELRIVVINQAEANRLNRAVDWLVGQICDEALWGQAAPAITKIVQNTFQTGNEGNWESQTNPTQRGPFTDREVRTYPIFSASAAVSAAAGHSPQVSQVIILAQDVSEKRHLQASLFRSANLAAVGRLASSIAHQINNPLTVIIANGQLMELETDPASPDFPIIQDIVESGAQIRQIVQNLVDFSTQDSYDWFETNLQATIHDALALITHSLRKSNIQITQQIDRLPPIVASANHLKLLWMNLLLNARDAIVERGQEGVITIRAMPVMPGYVQVRIMDDGVGILPEHREHLFRPFFTTKAPGQGLGLGLYTCRTIVDYHQGQIVIDPNPHGPGSIVTVTLPAQPVS